MQQTKDQLIFNALRDYLTDKLGIRIRFKDESILMRIIGVLLFFNRAFVTEYVTTIGRTIYFPTRDDVEGEQCDWYALAHEAMHVKDYVRAPIRFVFWYLFPQGLAIFAALALLAIPFTPISSSWWLCSLVFLLAALPWAAPGRACFEYRGFFMTMVCYDIEFGYVSSELEKEIQEVFTGPAYYYMAHDPAEVEIRVISESMYADDVSKARVYDVDATPLVEVIRKAKFAAEHPKTAA